MNEFRRQITPRASVIIPAHDEEALIGRCLDRLLSAAEPGEFDVIVVCNGTVDETASIASSWGELGVRVVEISEPSKIVALNTGDALAWHYPRIYLDADVELETSGLRALVASLSDGGIAASPTLSLDLEGVSVWVRMYYSVWSRIGYSTQNVLGSGAYALSEVGRSRFGSFPDVIADDFYVYCQFDRAERVNPAGAVMVVHVPRTLRSLARRRVRIELGNLQVQRLLRANADVAGPGVREVVLANPHLIAASVLYASVNAWAHLQARRRLRKGRVSDWGRDETRRLGIPRT